MYVVYAFHREREADALRYAHSEQLAVARVVSEQLELCFAEWQLTVHEIASAADTATSSREVVRNVVAQPSSGFKGVAVYDTAGRVAASAGALPALPGKIGSSHELTAELLNGHPIAAAPGESIVRIALPFAHGTVVADASPVRRIAAAVGHAIGHRQWHARVLAGDGTVLYDSARSAAVLSEIRAGDASCGSCHPPTTRADDRATRPDRTAVVGRSIGEISASATASFGGIVLTTVIDSPRSAAVRDVAKDIGLTLLLFAALCLALSVTWVTTYQAYRRRIRAEEAARSWKERHEMQQALLDAREHYRAVFESSHDAIIITDAGGQVKFANPKATEVLRQTENLFANFPRSAHEVIETAIRIGAAGAVATFDAVLQTPAGERLLSFNVVPYMEDGAVAGVISSGRDLTELKRDEGLIRESERRLTTMLNNTDTLAALGDIEGTITFCSTALLQLLGVTTEQALGRAWLDFVAPEDRDAVRGSLIEELPSGNYATYAEYSIVTQSGERRLTRWVRTQLLDDEGRIVGLGAVGEDLTARRLSEDRIRKLNDFYQRILEKTVAGVLVTDRADNVSYVNASFTLGTGVILDRVAPAAAAAGRIHDLVPPFAVWYDTAKSELRPVFFEAAAITRPDGSSRYHSGWMVPLTADGAFDGMICTTEDLTDRVAAEKALGSLQRRHEDLVDTVPGMVWRADAQTLAAEYISAYAVQFFGYPLAAWREPDFWTDHIHPDDRDRVVNDVLAAVTEGRGRALDYRFLAADGRAVWVRDAFRVVMEDGRPTELQGVIVDITERKEIESALAESESRFRALFEQSAIGIAVQWADREKLETNLAFREMFGYSGEDLSTTNAARTAGSSVRRIVNEIFDTLWIGLETSVQKEAVFRRRGGKQIWCRITASVIRDELEEPRMTVALFEDFTERKVAEEALEQSREKFRDLVEITTDWVWEVDPNGVYTYAGPRVRAILGYEPEEIIGRTPFDFMAPDEVERVRAIFAAAMAERKAFALMENVNIHRNGTRVVLETSGMPVFDANGSFTGYHGIDRDVSDREEHKRAHRRLAAAIEQSTEVVILTNRDGNIEYVNPAFEKISGYSRDEVVGLTPRILKSGVQSDDFYASLWARLLSGGSWSGRFVNRRKDGTTFEVEASISPILSDDGQISGFIGLQRDMTEHITLLERLHRAEEMDRVGRLISGVAHEVRNPLNGIQAALAALELDVASTDENQSLFRAMRSQVTRLSQLMRELLEFSKPIEPSRMERCSVDALCSEAIALWRSGHPDQPQERVIFEPLGTTLMVEVDRMRLHQVVINLLDNAHQHSPIIEDVVLRISRDNGYCRIEVVDRGAGVKPEHVSHVFDPFFTTRRGGTGLGLTLVKNIVEQHGGRVMLINNDPGPGCNAQIILKASVAVEQLEDAIETASR